MPIAFGPTVVPTSSAAIDRRTFGEIKRELAAPYNPDDDTTLALAADAWNSAIRAYNRYCWPWELLTVDLAIVAGTDTYALPQAFKMPKAASRLDTSSRPYRRLIYQPYDSFVDNYQSNLTATEWMYTLRNVFETGQVTFYPVPSAADTVRLWYYRRTPTLRRDEEPVEAPEEACEAMMDWARYLLVSGKISDAGRIDIAYRQAMMSRAELVAFALDRGDSVGLT